MCNLPGRILNEGYLRVILSDEKHRLEQGQDEQVLLSAYAELYDRRGGAVEIKESKQGVGVAKRNKKSYMGQQLGVRLLPSDNGLSIIRAR